MKNIRNSYQISRFAPAVGITLLTAAMLSAAGFAQAADEAPAVPKVTNDASNPSPPKATPGMKDSAMPTPMATKNPERAVNDASNASPPKATPGMKDSAMPTPMATEKSNRVMSDSWITTKVKAEILANSMSKAFKVSVTTKSGAVKLGGKLPSQDSIDLVKMIAEKVDGVKSVDTSGLSTTM
jgi:hyperosmotically inducible protein